MSHRVARVGGSQADILSTAVAQHAKKAHPKARRYREAVVTWVNGSLVLASLVCGFVGWKLGAASPQAPATPATFEVHVSALSLPHYRPPSHIDVLTSLHQLGRNYTALGVVVSAGFPATTQVYWNINFVWATAQSLAPNICEPDKADVPGMGPLTPPQMTTGSYLIQGTSPSERSRRTAVRRQLPLEFQGRHNNQRAVHNCISPCCRRRVRQWGAHEGIVLRPTYR